MGITMPEILKKGIWYIAYPYSNNPEGNYKECIAFTNKLLDLGITTFSPIILTHPIAKQKKRGYSFWMKFDGKYWEFMQGIILPINHEDSKGCNIERNWFKEHGKPIFIFDDVAIDFYKW